MMDIDKPNEQNITTHDNTADTAEKDKIKIQEVSEQDSQNLDEMPSANQQDRDTQSQKKLKTLAIFIGAILVSIVGIVMASSRYSENKEKKKAQEAEAVAQEQKKMATGSVNIADDQKRIQDSKFHDIPPPAGATDDTLATETATTPTITPRPADDVYIPPTPIPNSERNKDSMKAYQDYTPPAPMPIPTYAPNPMLFDDEPSVAQAEPTPIQNPQPIIQVQEPPVADVLVDVYGTKRLTAGATPVSDKIAEPVANLKQNERAKRHSNNSFTLTKGTNIPCVLKTKIDSTYQGFAVCQVSKDVYSSNGKILLIERGSSVFGEQNIQIKHGQARVYVIWQRLDTPKGVSVNLESPATGQLGEMGIGARVNNHFGKRFGGAIMLSLIQDAISAGTTRLQQRQTTGQTTIDNTSSTAEGMAEKALENSINIPPTAVVHQGTRINILVNKDMDFSGVYGVERAN